VANPPSPLLAQYREIKSRHTDAILFFRMGDFYEMFYEDAETAARALNITLTSRGDGVPLAGVPVKAAAGYLRQFVAQGYRVAICEQIEDPRGRNRDARCISRRRLDSRWPQQLAGRLAAARRRCRSRRHRLVHWGIHPGDHRQR
jgi:DNA mismatch repair protein MutS